MLATGLSSTSDAVRRQRFEALAANVADPMRRYLRRRVDEQSADDVLSESMIVLWRRLEDVPSDAVPWAIGIARKQLSNFLRSQRRSDNLFRRVATLDPPAVSPSPHDAYDSEFDDQAARVRSAIALMRDADAEVLRLWAWEEMKASQIATVLNISPNAAAVRLYRARSRFAAIYQITDENPHGKEER